jgi:hypothetical protein
VKPIFDSAFAEVCEVRYERATFQNFESFLESGNLFPRRITALHIEATPRASRFIDNCLFFFDAENPLDIIDYWNLRALGLTVIAVPQQAADETNLQEYALGFIHESFVPYRHNPGMFHHTTLIPSSCCSLKGFLKLVMLLQTTPSAVYP